MARSLSLPFAVVLIVWLAARIVYFNGYYTEDAPGYVYDAIAIAVGEYGARDHVNGLNLGTYGPVAIPLLVLGKTDMAISLWPLACSLLGLLSMAGIATLLFGAPYGLLAALLYATYPGDVFFSTVVMPDAIQSGWLSFSLFLAVAACLTRSTRQMPLLLAAGAAMGVCHIIRANGALLVPIGVFAIATISKSYESARWRDILDRCLAFAAGWCLVSLIEGVVYYWTVGDFLFRLHVVDRHYGRATSIVQFGLNTNPLTIPYSTLPPLTWLRFGGWLHFNPDQSYHGILFLLAVIACAVGAIAAAMERYNIPLRVRAGLIVSVLWLAWPLLYHQFGSQSLTEFIPIHRLSRHLVVYAPGAMLAIVAGVAMAWHARRTAASRAVVCVVTTLVIAAHLALNVRAERLAYDGYHRIRDTYARIRDRLPVDTRKIIADPGDLGFFDFWLNPLGERRVELQPFAMYQTCDALKDGVVLTYSNPGWEQLSAPVIQETVARLPCLVQPPPNWQLLYADFPEKVFVISAEP